MEQWGISMGYLVPRIAYIWLILLAVFPAHFAQGQTSKVNSRLNALEARLKQIEDNIPDFSKLSNDANSLNQSLSQVDGKLYLLQNRINKLEEKLSEIEKKVSDVQILRNSIADAELSNANAKFDIVTHYAGEIGIFLAILGIIIPVSGFITKNLIERIIVSRAEKRVNDTIENQMKIVKDLTIAQMHLSLSYTYYQHYADDFEAILYHNLKMTKSALGRITSDATIAKDFASRGLTPLIELKARFPEIATDKRWVELQAQLINLQLYNYTAELIGKQNSGNVVDNESRLTLQSYWEECIVLANSNLIRQQNLWYEMYDSAALAMINFGDAQSQARGKKLITDICSGKVGGRLAPPQQRIDAFKAEFGL